MATTTITPTMQFETEQFLYPRQLGKDSTLVSNLGNMPRVAKVSDYFSVNYKREHVEKRIEAIQAEREEERQRCIDLMNFEMKSFMSLNDQSGLFGKGKKKENTDYPGLFSGINKFLHEGITVKHEIDNESVDKSAKTVKRNVEEVVETSKEAFYKKFVPDMSTIKEWSTPMSVIAFLLAAIQWYRNGKFKKEFFMAAIALLLPEAYVAIKPYIIKVWQCLVKSIDKKKESKENEVSGEENIENQDNKKESEENLFKDQNGFSIPEFVSFQLCPTTIKMLTGAIAGIILGFIIKDARGLAQTVDRLVKLKDFPNLANGLYGIFDWFITAMESIVNWFRSLFKADKWFFWTSEYVEAENTIKEGYATISKCTTKERLTLNDIRYIEKINGKLLDFEMTLPKKASRELMLIANLKRAMVPLMQRVRRTNVQGSAGRISPVSILLCGESAIGKSNAQIAFAKAVCAMLLPKERLELFLNDPSEEIYARNVQSQYWEGYKSQFMIWYDDLGFMKSVAGQPSAESEMIPVKNEIPHMPDMAFGDKGKIFLNSDVILATSNFTKFVPENLAYPQAFINRWDITYVVTVNAKSPYCENPDEADPRRRRLKKDIPGVIEWYDHLEFIEFNIREFHMAQEGIRFKRNVDDVDIKNYLGKKYSFTETVNNFVEVYEAKRSKSVKLLQHQTDIINHFIKVRAKTGEPKEEFVEKSDTTSIPGGLKDDEITSYATGSSKFRDQDGVTEDPFIEEMREIEEKINRLCADNKEKKHLYECATKFQQGLKLSNSAFVDGESFYRVKVSKRRDHEQKFAQYQKERNIMKMRTYENSEEITGAYCLKTIDYIVGDDMSFEEKLCPLMSCDPELVVTPLGTIKDVNVSLEAKYLSNYYLALKASRETTIKILKNLQSDVLDEYPSLQNPRFVKKLDIGSTDEEQWRRISELGTVMGSIVRMCQLRQSEKMFRAKKVFKSRLYAIFGVSKKAVKEFICPTSMVETLLDVAKNAAYVLAVCMAMGYFVKGVSKYTNLLPILGEEDKSRKDKLTDQSNSNISAREMKQSRKPLKKMNNQAAYSENIVDSNVDVIIKKVLRRNVYVMYVGNVLVGSVIFISGHIAIMPKHFREVIRKSQEKGLLGPDKPLRLERYEAKVVDGKPIGGFSFHPKENNFILPKGDLKDQDVVFFDATGTGHQPSTPIIEYFISDEDINEEVYSQHATLYRVRGVNKLSERDIDARIKPDIRCVGGVRNKWSWLYVGMTQEGDCGSIIALHDHRVAKRKIAGFHTQGCGRNGCGPVIIQEQITEELEAMNHNYDTELTLDQIDMKDEGGDLQYPSLWKEKEFVAVPRHNPMCKSPVHGMITEPTKIPSNAHKYTDESGSVIDPCVKTLNKAHSENVAIASDVVNIIVEERYKRDKRNAPIETRGPGRIFTVEEACAGVEGDPLLKPIPRSTSAGHPDNVIAAKHGGGKYLWFGNGDKFSFDNEYFKKMKAEVLDIIYWSNKGKRYTFIYYCFPKFESLNKKEVKENRKLRMIYGGPLKLSATYRCLYMEFNRYLIENRIHNGFAAGINEHGPEWNTLGKILEPLHLIIGDHKGYDFRNKAVMLGSHAYHANLYYQDEYAKAREIIAIEAYNAKILFEGVVYDKEDGLGSGNPGTLFFNGDSNQEVLIYSACLVVFPDISKVKRKTIRNFIAELLLNSYIIVQGDDFIFGVNDRFKGILTFNTIRKAAKQIGYVITSADKTEDNDAPDYTPLCEATFLKRSFKKVDGKYVAPLDMESIDDMIQWVNKKKYDSRDFESVLETYLGELALHGEQVWFPKFKKLVHAARKVKLTWTPKFFRYQDYFDAITDRMKLFTMSPNEIWDYIKLKADKNDGIDDKYLDDEVLTHWRQSSLIAINDYDEFMMEDQAPKLTKNGVEDASEIMKALSASIALTDYQILARYNKRSERKEKRKEKRYAKSASSPQKGIGKEIVDSRNLDLSSEDPIPEKWVTLDDALKLSKIQSLYEDQANNMNSTTANTHDETPEMNHALDASISVATTEIISSESNNYQLTNTRLENKLRRIVKKQNDVREFFSKKKEIGTFSWATTDSIGTKLVTFDIDSILGATAMWTDKSRGYMNFKGTAVLTIQVNATPFHAGIFRVVWKPYVANDPDWLAFDRLHSISLVQISQLPGVFHSISTDTVQMKAPIIGPVDVKTLGAQPFTWNYGYFEVYVYTPLDTGAADTINLRAFLSFEDVNIDTPFYNQAGGAKNPTVEEKKEKGIISKTAGNLIPVVQGLSGVPFLTNIVGPAEWILKAVKGGAEAVGWSKPTVSDSASRIHNNNMAYALNTNGVDLSTVLSLDASNSCTTISQGSINSPKDEMSINFIKEQPGYYANINWTTSNVTGDVLAVYEQRPSYYTQTGSFPTSTTPITTYYMTPVCFVANLFKYWRGDLHFKILFSKTGYHSGTLAITYVPGENAAGLAYANSQYNFREIVDIQTCEEFCFTVPYVVPDPYKYYLSKAGSIYFHVVNPLKAPASVASGINMCILVSGASNMDFQVPLQRIPQAVFMDQGGDITNEGCESGSLMTDDDELKISFSAMCIGENIRSIKQLLQAYTIVRINTSNPVWSAPMSTASWQTIYIRPLDVHVTRYANTAGVYSLAANFSFHSDKFSTLASCYLYQRGSMRYSYSSESATNVTAFISDKVPSNTAPLLLTVSQVNSSGIALGEQAQSFASFNNTDNTILIKDPYYNKYPLTLTTPNYVQTQGWSTRYGNDHSIGFSSNTIIDLEGKLGFLQRAVGDDFQFSFWLGVPTLVIF